MDHEALESVPLGLHVRLAHKLLRKRDPIIQFLLLVCLWVDPEPLEVDQEEFGILVDADFFGCDLAGET